MLAKHLFVATAAFALASALPSESSAEPSASLHPALTLNDMPQCATACMEKASNDTGCLPSNTSCACDRGSDYRQQTHSCVVAQCPQPQLVAVWNVAKSVCGAAPNSSSTAATSVASATAKSTANSAVGSTLAFSPVGPAAFWITAFTVALGVVSLVL